MRDEESELRRRGGAVEGSRDSACKEDDGFSKPVNWFGFTTSGEAEDISAAVGLPFRSQREATIPIKEERIAKITQCRRLT